MSVMTKADIVSLVERESGLSPKSAKQVTENVLAAIFTSVVKGKTVVFRGFGTFMPVTRASRKVRDIERNLELILPEQKVVKFKPSKMMHAFLRGEQE